jgi:hypothetical protein
MDEITNGLKLCPCDIPASAINKTMYAIDPLNIRLNSPTYSHYPLICIVNLSTFYKLA